MNLDFDYLDAWEEERDRADAEQERAERAEAERDALRQALAEKDDAVNDVVRGYCEQRDQARAERDALVTALRAACPDEPMNQDEQGGCVWCGGNGQRLVRGRFVGSMYATGDPADHTTDCEWLAARALLASVGASQEAGQPASDAADVIRDTGA